MSGMANEKRYQYDSYYYCSASRQNVPRANFVELLYSEVMVST